MVQTRGGKDTNPQPAAPQRLRPARPKPAQGGGTKKGATTAKHTTEEEEDDIDEEADDIDEEEDAIDEEELDDDAASKPKRGNKRPTAAPNEGPSQKVVKTGAAGSGKRNATGSGPPSADAASAEQPPAPKKGNGRGNGKSNGKGTRKVTAKGKGKEKEDTADANVSAVPCYDRVSRLVKWNPCADVTRIGLNQQMVHKTMLKERNLRESLQKPEQPH